MFTVCPLFSSWRSWLTVIFPFLLNLSLVLALKPFAFLPDNQITTYFKYNKILFKRKPFKAVDCNEKSHARWKTILKQNAVLFTGNPAQNARIQNGGLVNEGNNEKTAKQKVFTKKRETTEIKKAPEVSE